MTDYKKAYGASIGRPLTPYADGGEVEETEENGGHVCEACGGPLPSEMDAMQEAQMPEPSPADKMKGFLLAVSKGR